MLCSAYLLFTYTSFAFLTRYFTCLQNDPMEKSMNSDKDLPGALYTLDEQCQFNFGKYSKTCSAVSSCFHFVFENIISWYNELFQNYFLILKLYFFLVQFWSMSDIVVSGRQRSQVCYDERTRPWWLYLWKKQGLFLLCVYIF